MGLQKNVAGQKWRVFAFNMSTSAPVLADAANITAKLSKDWGAATALTDVNPTEIEDGFYLFDLTQAESNANVLDLYPQSDTSGVQVVGVPGTVYTVPASFTSDDLAAIKNLLEADVVVDTTVTPWAIVYLQNGTGGLGVGTELLRQPLRDVAGTAITNTTTVIGSAGL